MLRRRESIPSRIAYKIDSLCHTALTTAYPNLLSELLNVYTGTTTALIIGSKYPQHCHSKDKVIWTASICLPGTHQLEQGPRIHKISTLFYYHFILLFIISSCVHYCSVLFPCDCLTFWIFCYYNLY